MRGLLLRWQRSLPVGLLHRQLLSMGSDRVYALAQRTDLILFWVGFLALFRGFLPDHAAVQHSPGRRGGRGHRSCAPALTRPTCRGAGVTGGSSITTSSFSADARSQRPDHTTSRPRTVSTSHRRTTRRRKLPALAA
jgi:hypothetical protein